MWQYLGASGDEMEKCYNRARFYAQLRMNEQAIRWFRRILEQKLEREEEKEIQLRSAHCLMCVYK